MIRRRMRYVATDQKILICTLYKNSTMLKADARKHYRQLRKAFSRAEVEEMSMQILDQIKRFDFSGDRVFHLFLPIEKNHEINTYPLMNWLINEKKTIVLPKVEGENMLNCRVNTPVETQLNNLSIPEPTRYEAIDSSAIDVVFVPLFVADFQGDRVGYGGGYYDRFLATCRPDTKKIGLSYFRPIEQIDDIFESDIALDYCVIPTEIVSFGERSSNVWK